MKIRRRWPSPTPTAPSEPLWELQDHADQPWRAANAATLARHDLAWLDALPRLRPEPAAARPLPFQPLSFRDGMLFEKHWIDSSRGYVRRFMPAAHRLTQAFEGLTGRTFPAFRPAPLWHRQPIYYFGNHLTVVEGEGEVQIPDYTQALDFELELGWVLARPLYNATPDEAMAAIGGFVVINDWSARDVQRAEMQTGLGPQKSKHFLSSMSLTMATPAEILPNLNRLSAQVAINGNTVTRTATTGMRHHPGEVLAHLSRSERLYPGELIASGTLPGGSGMETGHWLKRGDHVRLSIDGVGEIHHTLT